MAGVTNGDGPPIGELFGIPADPYYHTNAGGSQGDRSNPGAVELAGETGIPGVGTVESLSYMADPGARHRDPAGSDRHEPDLPRPAARLQRQRRG